MYRFKQQGIALLLVLLFMQIIALLGLYSLSSSRLLQKISSDYWIYSIKEMATLAKPVLKENTNQAV
jgi:Tfp pilus assembly protein PilX